MAAGGCRGHRGRADPPPGPGQAPSPALPSTPTPSPLPSEHKCHQSFPTPTSCTAWNPSMKVTFKTGTGLGPRLAREVAPASPLVLSASLTTPARPHQLGPFCSVGYKLHVSLWAQDGQGGPGEGASVSGARCHPCPVGPAAWSRVNSPGPPRLGGGLLVKRSVCRPFQAPCWGQLRVVCGNMDHPAGGVGHLTMGPYRSLPHSWLASCPGGRGEVRAWLRADPPEGVTGPPTRRRNKGGAGLRPGKQGLRAEARPQDHLTLSPPCHSTTPGALLPGRG